MNRYIINIEKGKTSNGYTLKLVITITAILVGGRLLCFYRENYQNMIISKIAVSNFFAICSNMLTFHKHSSFHKLSITACEYKESITAGENTVKRSYLYRNDPTVILYNKEIQNSTKYTKRNTNVNERTKTALSNAVFVYLKNLSLYTT